MDVPERHAEMGLVSERQRGVANPLEVRESILQDPEVTLQSGGNGGMNHCIPHDNYPGDDTSGQGHRNKTKHETYIRCN